MNLAGSKLVKNACDMSKLVEFLPIGDGLAVQRPQKHSEVDEHNANDHDNCGRELASLLSARALKKILLKNQKLYEG